MRPAWLPVETLSQKMGGVQGGNSVHKVLAVQGEG